MVTLNLDAYLTRIGWPAQPIQHDLPTLTALLQAHMQAIPFENLDVLLGRGIRIDLGSVQDKLVRQRRGGYCFEHATLLAAVLEVLGFAPVRHLARVTLFVPRAQAGRTHMFLSVPLPEGRFVVDPGFGAHAARRPLPLQSGEAVAVEGDVHTLVQEADGRTWVLRAQIGAETTSAQTASAAGGSSDEPAVEAWVSTLEPESAIDFQLGNHYTSSHRDSAFVSHLMLRAFTPDGRVTVMDRAVTLRRRGRPPERWLLADRAALRALLATYFGIDDLPEVARLRVPAIPGWE
jgi:N-hydroxyarylamine O-acetyltransferase